MKKSTFGIIILLLIGVIISVIGFQGETHLNTIARLIGGFTMGASSMLLIMQKFRL